MSDDVRAVTYCAACDFVHDRKPQPRYWLCVRHVRLPAYDGFLSTEAHEKSEPYLRCSQTNAGACPLFTPRRTGAQDVGGK